MSTIIYYLTLPFLYLISHLPFKVLYLLSDLFYLLIYKLFGYRKKVVTENLENAFPEKSAAEIEKICSDFYRFLCDLSLETIKTLSISPSALKKHFKYDDMSVFEHYYKKKQSVIMVMGHLGSWEMGGAYFSQLPLHQLYVIYHPLANKRFDRLLYRMRTRSGTKLYAMKDTFRGMIKNRKEVTATAFISDQTPSPDNAHWMTFLNRDTAVFKGTEIIARKLDYPVIYLSVIREKRGQYSLHSELLAEHPKQLSENELTELHTQRLEQDIINHPETWLWSHRRWKHKRPEKQVN
jgi:KDO2-lipid IV(A) lauroyltransferase